MTNQSPNPRSQNKLIQTLFIVISLVISYSSFVIAPVMAQVNISTLTYPGQKITPGDLSNLLTGAGFDLVSFIFFLAGAIFLTSLLQAAWGYVNSTGDQKKVAESTTRLLNSFYGILMVLGSFIIVRLVLAVLGIKNILKIV